MNNFPPSVGEVSMAYTYDVESTDPDGPTNTFNLLVPASLPANMSFVNSTGILTWPPLAAGVGQEVPFKVEATDADNDPLTYAIVSGPAGMNGQSSGGLRDRLPGKWGYRIRPARQLHTQANRSTAEQPVLALDGRRQLKTTARRIPEAVPPTGASSFLRFAERALDRQTT